MAKAAKAVGKAKAGGGGAIAPVVPPVVPKVVINVPPPQAGAKRCLLRNSL